MTFIGTGELVIAGTVRPSAFVVFSLKL